MAIAAAARRRRTEFWKVSEFVFASGDIGYKGTRAFLNPLTNRVVCVPAPGLIAIGMFAETVDTTLGERPCQVDFEGGGIWIEWFINETAGNAVLATDVGKLCYHPDDQTVAITPLGKVLAGRVWKVDATKGVAVQKLDAATDVVAPTPVAAAYVANDYAPAAIINGAIYDVPTTAAVSTVTLPTAAADGTVAYFQADGTKNGHTVQYRDGAGSVLLTTALIASKRHLVVVSKRDAIWAANAYVAP